MDCYPAMLLTHNRNRCLLRAFELGIPLGPISKRLLEGHGQKTDTGRPWSCGYSSEQIYKHNLSSGSLQGSLVGARAGLPGAYPDLKSRQ
jgi:hypothetical protein